MIRNALSHAAIATVLYMGFAAGIAPASAEETKPGAKPMDSITVVAPRTTETKQRMGSAVREITAKREARVDLRDLDLARRADWQTLEERVDTAAVRICRELAGQLPRGRPDTTTCVRRAVDDALAQVEEATRYEVAESR